jgi:Putative adhesin
MTKKFDTPVPVSAVLDIPAGRIQFIAAYRTDTTVEVLPADASKRRDVKAAEQTTVAYGEGVLRIETSPATNRILGATGSLEVTVQLPAGSRIRAKAARAEFRGVGPLGDVAFEGAQGSVKIDEAETACFTLLAGDISVGHLGGPAEISTQKGDIHIAEAVRGALELHTDQGEILVGAAHGVSACLDGDTTYGRIHNTLKDTDDTAGLTIHATTAYGDITARSL